MQLLWLYGPQAVGKSVTAWEVLNALATADSATGYVDVDQLGMSFVDDNTDPQNHRLKGRALAAVAGEFAGSGVRTLVASGVIGLELMEFYEKELEAYDPIFIRLTAPYAELRRRLAARGPYAEEWAGVEKYARSLDASVLAHPVVESGPGTPAKVAARVLRETGAMLAGRRQRDSDGHDREVESKASHSGEAILIGGTTAVGKSTIGWHAFMATGEAGRQSSFIDLRQLGFTGVDGGAINHRLQARAASALWSVFRAHGADLLILNGRVNTPAELSTYRTALVGTQLRAVRLTAERSALVERVRARMRGEMAPLAGDTLVGRPCEEAETIADAAVRLQAGTETVEAFPSLDTTTLDAAEAARRVLSGH